MALKTFNLDEEVYKEYSKHCKTNGISMSKRVENFIKEELEKYGIKQTPQEEIKIKEPEVLKDIKMPSPKNHPMNKYC